MSCTPFSSCRIRWATACLLLASWGCCANPFGPITQIRSTGSGVDSPADAPACAAFKVSPKALASFLQRAVLITPRQEHDFFLHGPCYVDGTFTTRYGNWQWRMRNLGTLSVTSDDGEHLFLFADPRSESSLADD